MVARRLVGFHVEVLLTGGAGQKVRASDEWNFPPLRFASLPGDFVSEFPKLTFCKITMTAHRKFHPFERKNRFGFHASSGLGDVSCGQNETREAFIIPHWHRSQWPVAHAAITRRMRVFKISGSSPKNGSEPCVFAVPMSAE